MVIRTVPPQEVPGDCVRRRDTTHYQHISAKLQLSTLSWAIHYPQTAHTPLHQLRPATQVCSELAPNTGRQSELPALEPRCSSGRSAAPRVQRLSQSVSSRNDRRHGTIPATRYELLLNRNDERAERNCLKTVEQTRLRPALRKKKRKYWYTLCYEQDWLHTTQHRREEPGWVAHSGTSFAIWCGDEGES